MTRYQEKVSTGNQMSTRKFPKHGFAKTGASWGGWIRTTDYLIQSSRISEIGQTSVLTNGSGGQAAHLSSSQFACALAREASNE